MTEKKSAAQRLGLVLEKVTSQSSRLLATPEYGSWVLGRVSESQRKRRIRIQIILTTFVLSANLIGVAVAVLVVTVTFPVPSVFDSKVLWITFAVAPAYIGLAFIVGVIWATNRVINNVRWAIEEREPSPKDQRNTFFAPWRLTRVLLVLWGGGTVVLTVLYGLQDTDYIPKVLLGHQLSGHCRVGELLSVHRVRTASGRRAGTRGRPSAAPVRTGHHGPHAHRMGVGFGCAGARHPAGRHHHAFAAERVRPLSSPSR